MRRPRSVLDGFFSDDAEAVCAAVAALDQLPDSQHLNDLLDGGDSLNDARIFGPEGADQDFGYLEIPAGPHPLVPSVTVTRVPVPPPGDRPPQPPSTTMQRERWSGPLNLAWATLMERVRLVTRVREPGDPAAHVAERHAALADALAEVVDWTRSPPPPPYSAWTKRRSAHSPLAEVVPRGGLPLVASDDPDGDDYASAAVFLDARRLVLQREAREPLVVVDVESGAIVARVPSCGRHLVWAAAGRYLVFDGVAVERDAESDEPNPVACFDLDAVAWCERWPDGVACVTAVEEEVEGYATRVLLVDRRRSRTLAGPYNRYGEGHLVLAFSGDGRFVWWGDECECHAVSDVESGILQVYAPSSHDELVGRPRAVALLDDRFVFLEGSTFHDKERRSHLETHCNAAAFFPDGRGFVLVRDRDREGIELLLHDEAGSVVRALHVAWDR